MTQSNQFKSQEHTPANLLDVHSTARELEHFYKGFEQREFYLMKRYCNDLFEGSDISKRVLSVGCGPDARRGLPDGSYYLAGTDSSPEQVEKAKVCGSADSVQLAAAQSLPYPDDSFDVVLFRLVLHHVIFQGSLEPVLGEARRVLRPGGTIILVEPNIYHPVGALLAAANQLGVAEWVHGTVDDCPLSPFHLSGLLTGLGFGKIDVHGITYSWRRLPILFQRMLEPMSRWGSYPILRYFAHSFTIIARNGTQNSKVLGE